MNAQEEPPVMTGQTATPPMDVSEFFWHIGGVAVCGHVHPSYDHEEWQRKALRWALDYIDAFAMPHGGQYEDGDYQRAASLVGDEVFEYPQGSGMWHRGNREEIEAEYSGEVRDDRT